VSYLVRSWNVFHGRTSPPGRHAFLQEAVELAVRDVPDVLCLQEVPVWGVSRLGAWTGMTAIGHTTVPAGVGRLPMPHGMSRWLTDLHHGIFRSLFSGQANAVLVGGRIEILAYRQLVLNDRPFRLEHARAFGLDRRTRFEWARNRRLCQVIHTSLADGRALLVVNVHASSFRSDLRIADAELRRASYFASDLAAEDEVAVFCGDFNLRPGESSALAALRSAGYSPPGPGIDHILVRGASASMLEVWPEDRRRVDGRLLSDHAPVELRFD
jgi:endonuclease/exonuclease/phosphatase family metal-dependent hydrolase